MTLVYESKEYDGTTEICILKLGGDRWLNESDQKELVIWLTKNRSELLEECGWIKRRTNLSLDEALNMGDGVYKP